MLKNQYLNETTSENKIHFKSRMTKNNTFSEKYLAHVLSISPDRLRRVATSLFDSGEIMVYGEEDSREYKLEDAYVILTRFRKKEQIQVLEQFKKEFFHG